MGCVSAILNFYECLRLDVYFSRLRSLLPLDVKRGGAEGKSDMFKNHKTIFRTIR